MPIYTIPYNKESGGEIDVLISRPASTTSPGDIATSKRRLRLLIDTGASKTALNPKRIAEMNLIPSGKHLMRTAIGEKLVLLYPVDLTYEASQPPFVLPDLTIMEFPSLWRDGVIGRDFLEKVIL